MLLRFLRHPDPFDYAPGSVDRGLFSFLLQPFAPILRLADGVHEVPRVVVFCSSSILPRSCETFAREQEKILRR